MTADDIMDFFAIAIAALLDNDSNLTTPRHLLRIGAETAAKHIERRAKKFRAMQGQAGISWFSLAMERAEAPATRSQTHKKLPVRELCNFGHSRPHH